MVPQTWTRCPYTLRPLATIAQVNNEHIFPDAIGGVLDYKINVDAQKNSDLGTLIDSPLVSSTLITAMRLMHGIKARSGDPEWTLKGKIKGTEKEVEITFQTNGETKLHVRKPFEPIVAGGIGTITVSSQQRDELLRTVVNNYARKGKTVNVRREVSLGNEVEADLSLDLAAVKRGLIKIAYAALYEYLGDQFLDDPLIPKWHKAIFSASNEDAMAAHIHDVEFDYLGIIKTMLPKLNPYEHAVAIANMQQKGPVVAVSLFGRSFHSLSLVASESSNFGLEVLEGKIAICDAKNGRTRFMSFTDHFLHKGR